MNTPKSELLRRIEIAKSTQKSGIERKKITIDNIEKDCVILNHLHDPVEDTLPDYIDIKKIEQRANSTIKFEGMGRCHLVWTEMKRILKDEHGITWHTPAEMNIHTKFD